MIKLRAGQRLALDQASYRLDFRLNACTWGLVLVRDGVASRFICNESGVSVSEFDVSLCLDDIDPNISKMCFYAERYSFEVLTQPDLNVDFFQADVELAVAQMRWSDTEVPVKAISLFEIYRSNSQWRLHCVLQGFTKGIDKLFEWYGLSDAVVPDTVTHHDDIDQFDENDGVVALTWLQQNTAKQRPISQYLGEQFSPLTDLRIGCFYQLKNGQSGMVQSIGESPIEGSYNGLPYVQAEHALNGGLEQLNINMRFKHKLYRYLIYVLKWESLDNWADINAKIKVSLTELPNQMFQPKSLMVKPICAVAMLQFDDQAVTLTPLDMYFDSFHEMDDAYGWNLPWHTND